MSLRRSGVSREFDSLISDAEEFAVGGDSISASRTFDTLLLSLISGSEAIERGRARSRGRCVVVRTVVVAFVVVAGTVCVCELRGAIVVVGRRLRLSMVVTSTRSATDVVVSRSISTSVVSTTNAAVVASLGALVVVRCGSCTEFMRLLADLRGGLVRFVGLAVVVGAVVVSSSSESLIVASVVLVVVDVVRSVRVVTLSALDDCGGGASPNTLLTLLSVLTLVLCRAPNKTRRTVLVQEQSRRTQQTYRARLSYKPRTRLVRVGVTSNEIGDERLGRNMCVRKVRCDKSPSRMSSTNTRPAFSSKSVGNGMSILVCNKTQLDIKRSLRVLQMASI